jgi:hypothetical protein
MWWWMGCGVLAMHTPLPNPPGANGMGATSFTTHTIVPKKSTDQEAFRQAVEAAKFEHGHGGYSGTIAEKSGVLSYAKARSKRNAERMASALIHTNTSGVMVYREEASQACDDKWGPACAIRYPVDAQHDGVLFFGYASC